MKLYHIIFFQWIIFIVSCGVIYRFRVCLAKSVVKSQIKIFGEKYTQSEMERRYKLISIAGVFWFSLIFLVRIIAQYLKS